MHASLNEVERFVCAENCWERLPPLPTAYHSMSGVVVESSLDGQSTPGPCLYALGGWNKLAIDLVQRLDLRTLSWEVLQLKLPCAGYSLCFKVGSGVYIVMHNNLYSFSPQTMEVKPYKTLSRVHYFSCGPSYYCRGTLYCPSEGGAAHCVKVGRLS
jgi:hypothetical protein